MKEKMKNMSKRTIALFAAALLLFCTGSYSAVKAALNVVSTPYDASMKMANELDVTILEGKDGTPAGESSAILSSLKDEKNVVPGKVYDETLALKNNNGHPMYVRAIVRKYWLDADGNKGTNLENSLDPALIHLSYNGEDYNSTDWIRDDKESTAESDTYYYKNVLTDTSTPLFDGISVDKEVLSNYSTSSKDGEGGKKVVTYTYQYDGCTVCVEVEAQAVQTHSAEDAIKSVWGVDAVISGDTLQSIN